MKYIVDYALEKGFKIVLFPPIEKEGVEFPSNVIVIKTGVSYRVRSIFLVRTSDVLVVLGGASGTIQEITSAYCENKAIFVLVDTGFPSDKISCLG